MKKSLQFSLCCVILFFAEFVLFGQTVVLSEDFSGFTTGSHSTPSTSDASASLDTKTQVSGWLGSMIYPAGGEVKIGTSSSTGWIETPQIDLSGNGGNFIVKFDLCRWTGDATTVQVYMNGTALGVILTPSNDFQTVQINGTGGTSTSKIKIQALTKRFFIDNFSVTSDNTLSVFKNIEKNRTDIRIYPIPVHNKLVISNINYVNLIEIIDMAGKVIRRINNELQNDIEIEVENLNEGIYFIRFSSGKEFNVRRFIKE